MVQEGMQVCVFRLCDNCTCSILEELIDHDAIIPRKAPKLTGGSIGERCKLLLSFENGFSPLQLSQNCMSRHNLLVLRVQRHRW